MTAPILAPGLARLRSDFNSAFPGRDTTSDGWIGDTAHQGTVSGHNPDDTPGVRAEREDLDNIAEVRAVDIDKDLRSVVSMQQVIDRMLKTPADLRRLIYIIYNRKIWRKSDNWEPDEYDGLNPHDQHAHFSGDPAYDNDTSAWVVAQMGADVSVDDVVVGTSVLWDKAANRADATGRNFADDVYKAISMAVGDEFATVTSATAALEVRVAALEASLDTVNSKLNLVLDRLNALQPGGPALRYMFTGEATPVAE